MLRTSRWWARQLERERAAWDAERRELLDRLMHLAGRTWTQPPPVSEPEPDVSIDDRPKLEPL